MIQKTHILKNQFQSDFDKDCINFREKLLRIQYEVYFKKKFIILSKLGLYKFASNKFLRLIYNYFKIFFQNISNYE